MSWRGVGMTEEAWASRWDDFASDAVRAAGDSSHQRTEWIDVRRTNRQLSVRMHVRLSAVAVC